MRGMETEDHMKRNRLWRQTRQDDEERGKSDQIFVTTVVTETDASRST